MGWDHACCFVVCSSRSVDFSSLQSSCPRSEVEQWELRRSIGQNLSLDWGQHEPRRTRNTCSKLPALLIAISKPRILLIRQIALRLSILIEKNSLHRTRVCSIGDSGLACNPIPGGVVSHTYEAVRNHRDEQKTPRYDGSHDSAEVARPLGPQLGRGDAAGAVPNEEHCADDGAFCVSFGVGRCQGEEG